MIGTDYDPPRAIYIGPLPPHLARREAPPDDPSPAAPDQPRHDASTQVTVAAAAALALGIAIGLVVPPLMRTASAGVAQPPPAPPAVVAMTEPATTPIALSPPATSDAVTEATPQPPPAAEPAPRPAVASTPLRAALALLSPLPAKAPLPPGRRLPADAGCSAAASRADQAVCADPALEAADQELKRAYQRAAAAGAKPDALWSGQIAWLLAREEAAARSPADLAAAYRGRTAELNALAAEPPH